jgi:hypothetical protein
MSDISTNVYKIQQILMFGLLKNVTVHARHFSALEIRLVWPQILGFHIAEI